MDELLLYVAPKLLGPAARALVQLPRLTQLSEAPQFVLIEMQQIGADVRLRLRPIAAPDAPAAGNLS